MDDETKSSAVGRRNQKMQLLFAALVIAGISSGTFAAGPFAASTVELVALTAPTEAVSADLDSDGDVDFATLNAAGDLEWHERAAAFTTHVIAAALASPRSLRLADLDCDGDQDLTLIEDGTNSLAWVENRGGSWSGRTIATGRAIGDYAIADFDSDGSPDFAVTFQNDGALEVLRNVGCDGIGWPVRSLSSTLLSPRHVIAARLTSDGAVDVAVHETETSDLLLFENLGGAPWTQTSVANIPSLIGMAPADYDLDGDVDIAALTQNEFVIWNAPSTGTAWERAIVADEGIDDGWLLVADVGRDARPDLLAIHHVGPTRGATGDRVLLWQREAASQAWTSSVVVDGATEIGLLAIVDDPLASDDGNPDGALDLVLTETSGNRLGLLANQSPHFAAGFPGPLTIPYGFPFQSATDLDFADLDGDGDLDIAVVDQSPSLTEGWVYWLENRSTTGDTLPLAGPNPLHFIDQASFDSVVLADFDQDGAVDAVVGGKATVTESAAFCANGAATPSTFWPCNLIDSGQHDEVSVHEAADFDGDGDLDVLATVREGLSLDVYAIWWQLDDDPTQQANWTRQDIGTLSSLVELRSADLDGDGDLDVVARNGTWWLNDGGSPPSWTSGSNSDISGTPHFADIDRDGDLDALSIRSALLGVDFAWFENNLDQSPPAWSGHEIWTPPSSVGPGAAVTAGDLDLDGDVDFVGGTTDTTQARIWFENVDPATPWTPHTLPGADRLALELAAADLDRDGDLDLLAIEGGLTVHLNGAGQFALTATALTTAAPAATDTALLRLDLDHRGRVDDVALALESLQLVVGFDASTPMTQSEWDERFAALRIHLDDGSGTFDESLDVLLHISTPTLDDDVVEVVLPTDLATAHTNPGSPVTLFVVVETADDADTLPVADFVLEVLASGARVVGDDGSGPWRPEWSQPELFGFVLQSPPLFADSFESGDTGAWSTSQP